MILRVCFTRSRHRNSSEVALDRLPYVAQAMAQAQAIENGKRLKPIAAQHKVIVSPSRDPHAHVIPARAH